MRSADDTRRIKLIKNKLHKLALIKNTPLLMTTTAFTSRSTASFPSTLRNERAKQVTQETGDRSKGELTHSS